MAWTTPIIDRSAADVAAKNLKGQFNASDLNRIETNCAYIAEQLNGYGYSVTIMTKTDWATTDYPTKGNLDRIRSNIQACITVYAQLQGTPAMDFTTSLNWDDANDLEQNLANLKTLLERMIAGFRICGGFNFYSGNYIILP